MRYLTIVRHGESTPAPPGATDFERGLTDRGKQQCEELREWASDPDALGRFGPTIALVSSAQRTRETFRRAFAKTDFVRDKHYSELIYNGRREVTPEDLLIELAAIDPVTTSLLVVAHNPTVLELMLLLAKEIPHSLRKFHYRLGAAYVLALPDDRPVGLKRYEVVSSYLPS